MAKKGNGKNGRSKKSSGSGSGGQYQRGFMAGYDQGLSECGPMAGVTRYFERGKKRGKIAAGHAKEKAVALEEAARHHDVRRAAERKMAMQALHTANPARYPTKLARTQVLAFLRGQKSEVKGDIKDVTRRGRGRVAREILEALERELASIEAEIGRVQAMDNPLTERDRDTWDHAIEAVFEGGLDRAEFIAHYSEALYDALKDEGMIRAKRDGSLAVTPAGQKRALWFSRVQETAGGVHEQVKAEDGLLTAFRQPGISRRAFILSEGVLTYDYLKKHGLITLDRGVRLTARGEQRVGGAQLAEEQRVATWGGSLADQENPRANRGPAKRPSAELQHYWLRDAIQRKGKLGGKGFLSKPRATQKQILAKCQREYGYRSCLGSVMVLERIPETRAKYGRTLTSLRKWLVKEYGGPGSFGPRGGKLLRERGRRRALGNPNGAPDARAYQVVRAGKEYSVIDVAAPRIPVLTTTSKTKARRVADLMNAGKNPGAGAQFMLIPEISDCPACMVKTNPGLEAEMADESAYAIVHAIGDRPGGWRHDDVERHAKKISRSLQGKKMNPDARAILRRAMRGT